MKNGGLPDKLTGTMPGITWVNPRSLGNWWTEFVTPEVTFGRQAPSQLILDDERIAPLHGRFQKGPEGTWRIEEFAEAKLEVNGEQVEAPTVLTSGDTIGLPGDDSLTWVFVNSTGARNAPLEERIANTGTHEDWQVYADFLINAGDPLGETIARSAGALSGESPAIFSAAIAAHELRFEWEYGTWRSVIVSARGRRAWARWLALALAMPQGRFIRTIAVDCRSLRGSHLGQEETERIVDKILGGPLPPSLRRLEFGSAPYRSIPPREISRRVPNWDGAPLDDWNG